MEDFLSPEFIEALNGWIFENRQGYADRLSKIKIPPLFARSSVTLYRGMSVSQGFIDAVDNGNMQFSGFSSWSKDKVVAKKFASDLQFKTGPESGPITIMIRRPALPKEVVLDIDFLTSFYGDELLSLGIDETNFDSMKKEAEVLMRPGLKILPRQMTIIG